MAFDRDDDILCDDTIYYLYPLPPAPPAGEIRSTALGVKLDFYSQEDFTKKYFDIIGKNHIQNKTNKQKISTTTQQQSKCSQT